jgi:hypothetical protein
MRTTALLVGALAAVALGACSSTTLSHFAPGVVDDALAGVLTYGHDAPSGSYRLGGGPGTSPRGCYSTSNSQTRDGRAAPGVSFACEEDFDATGTSDYIAAGYNVSVAQNDCWTATRTYLFFIVKDSHGPPPDLGSIPGNAHGCGLPTV